MAYVVYIKYTGPLTEPSESMVTQICSMYCPTNSYADSSAYNGTVYDTNVTGFGTIESVEPYSTSSFPFPVPFAQFKLAVFGGSITFIVSDYKEAFYYKTVGEQLADQGFEVTVTADGDFASVTGVTLATASVAHGTDLTLTPTITPANATVQNVTWILSDAGTTGATLNGNVLSTTASGTAKVKASVKDGVLSSGVISTYTSSDLSITVS